MAVTAPPYKVYDAEGVFVCGAGDLHVAQAVLAHAGWHGWNVRLGHSPRNILFTEGVDGDAKAKTFIDAAEGKLPKGKKPHTAKRLMTLAESKAAQDAKREAQDAKAKAKAEREAAAAAKREAVATAEVTAPVAEDKPKVASTKPATPAAARPIKPAPKSAAKPRASKAAASKAAASA